MTAMECMLRLAAHLTARASSDTFRAIEKERLKYLSSNKLASVLENIKLKIQCMRKLMKLLEKCISIALACSCSTLMAATCEENFRTERDPRNGAEYFTSVDIANVSVESALGQLRGIASADGFTIFSETADSKKGILEIEQSKGVARPFLIQLSVANKTSASEVGIHTRLQPGQLAKAEDIRRSMCGMLARIQSGKEGEASAAAARKNIVPEKIIEIKAIDLARELFRLTEKQSADITNAHYKGKRYLLDGQIDVSSYDYKGLVVEVRYNTIVKLNAVINSRESKFSPSWPKVVCNMAPDQAAAAIKLKESDWAKLSGKVLRYSQGLPNILVLENCAFVN
jgi:hypothetical protein